MYEENIPVDSEKEHLERVNLTEYKSKLSVNGILILNPLTIKTGWISESEGIKYWPKLYLTDISHFYADVIGKKKYDSKN